ncbi:MAG TPA: response regulator [Bryobacteraceae bacterium]|jgi:CheY-like chemotaxis protein
MVLIVDDDPAFCSDLRRTLEDAGYSTMVRDSGPEGIKAAEEFRDRIDVAVIDIVLPGMNGFEVVGALKRRPNNIKIVVTSLVMRDLYLEAAKTFGAHAVVRKERQFNGADWLRGIEDVIKDVKAKRADQGT